MLNEAGGRDLVPLPYPRPSCRHVTGRVRMRSAIPRDPGRERTGAAHGVDVDVQGNGTITEQRLYELIRPTRPCD